MNLALTTSATSVRVVHETRCPELGPICATRPEPPQLHDQRFALLEVRLTGEYAITERLGVELQLPLKVSRTRIEYRRLDGTAFEPDYRDIHHRDETLAGPGDPWLLGRAAGRAGGFDLTGKLGVSLPLGSTEANPFALGAMGLEHQHVQLGAGIVAPVAVASAARRLDERFAVRLHGQAQLMLYENGHGYRAGSRYAAGLAGRWHPTGALTVDLRATVAVEEAERWDGEILQDGNLGRTDGLAGAALGYALGPYVLSVALDLPVYQHLAQRGDEAAQLSFPAILELGVSRGFGGAAR